MELVKYKNALVLPGATKTSLSLPDEITFDEWQEVGQQIMSCTHSCMWWLGDWWAFGDHKYGERAAQELLGHASILTTQIYTHLNFHYLAMEYDRTHPRAYRKEKSIGNIETELMLSH